MKNILESLVPTKPIFIPSRDHWAPALGICIAIAVVAGLISLAFYSLQEASAQLVDTRITAPNGDKPYGGAPLGTLTIDVKGEQIHVTAKMSSSPELNKQFEGWLVDAGQRASGVKLSLGAFDKSNVLDFQQTMINPYTYSEFQVTQEPVQDKDPKAAGVIGGAALPSPFAQ